MTYTSLAIIGIAFAVVLDQLLLKTKLLRRRVFWVSYAIMVVFQLLTNGVLTGRAIVIYNSHDITGVHLVYAPIEDLAFGFSLIVQTLAWWVWWGRRLPDRGAPVSRSAPRRNSAGVGGKRDAETTAVGD